MFKRARPHVSHSLLRTQVPRWAGLLLVAACLGACDGNSEDTERSSSSDDDPNGDAQTPQPGNTATDRDGGPGGRDDRHDPADMMPDGSGASGPGPIDGEDDEPSRPDPVDGEDDGPTGSPNPDPVGDDGAGGEPSRVQPTEPKPVPVDATPVPTPTYVPWVDERPPRPDWEPAAPMGESGWKESTAGYCSPFTGHTRVAGLSADANGVYFLHAVTCQNAEAGICPEEGQTLQYNDGTGWTSLLLYNDYMANDLIGVTDEGVAVLAWQYGTLIQVKDGELWKLVDVGGPFVAAQVGATDTFYVAAAGEATDEEFESAANISLVTSDQSVALGTANGVLLGAWASKDRALFSGQDQLVVEYRSEGEALREIKDVPVGSYPAVWGVGDDGLWLGNSIGQLVHYDGKSWSVVETGVDEPIEQLWGNDDTLFFRSGHAFGRATAAGAELIVAPDAGLSVHSLSGISTEDVFVVLEDHSFEQYECGAVFVAWFDGEVLHPM